MFLFLTFKLTMALQTKSIKYLEENFAAGDITLTDEDLKAIREVTDANKPVGDHYSERFALLKGE